MYKPILLSCAVLVAAGTPLATEYAAEKGFQVEFESTVTMKTTASSMERDGEPVEGRGGGAGGASTQTRKAVMVDTVVAAKDGKPTKLTRLFESLSGSNTTTRGDEEMTRELEPPLSGVTLALEVGDNGDVSVKVVDGTAPSDDAVLEGHRLELALDALLPEGEIADGGSWEPDKDAVRRALMLDLEKQLFPRPAPPEGEGGGGDRPRGGFRGGMGNSDGRLFEHADWECKATLTDEKAERGGVECRVIELEIKAGGELPEPQMPEGGGRRGQALGLEPERAPFGTTYKVELEGKLFFSTADKRPAGLEVEGSLGIETDREMQGRDGSSMRIRSTREGTFVQKVTITRT